MSSKTFEMSSELGSVDPMVLCLKAEVEPVLSDETRFRFEICLSEILANLVVHSQKKVSGNEIEIHLEFENGRASVEIFDPVGAEPFDLREHATDLAKVDAMAEGGRGLGLIMECADEVKYGRSGDRYSLCLKFWDTENSDENAQSSNGASE